LIALHDHNEAQEAERLVPRMLAGERFALVSDAGTPLVSDPGFRLVRAAIAAGVAVGAVPGPNAAVMALTLSGLPPHPFLFAGFLPAKERRGPPSSPPRRAGGRRLSRHAGLLRGAAPRGRNPGRPGRGPGRRPPRRGRARADQALRGGAARPLAELAAHYAAHAIRGEVVLCVGPAPPPAQPQGETLDAALRAAMAAMSVRDAAASVAAATGLPRKQVYARALELGAGAGAQVKG
jgi:16S rRNA (cytidine1402-2'-O)-methyltransferase